MTAIGFQRLDRAVQSLQGQFTGANNGFHGLTGGGPQTFVRKIVEMSDSFAWV
jgi:hypothetical protein